MKFTVIILTSAAELKRGSLLAAEQFACEKPSALRRTTYVSDGETPMRPGFPVRARFWNLRVRLWRFP
jgi:hypothetical protein